jgi:hypothetical protein
MGVGWSLIVDSFMSQFNSGLLLALPGRVCLGFVYAKQQLHAVMAFGTSISPYYNVQLSSDIW